MAKNKKYEQNRNKMEQVKHNKKVEVADTPSGKGAVICILVILVVFILTYFLTVYITDKNKRSAIGVKDARIQYEVILVGESFNQNKDDYIVLYYDYENTSDYSEVLSKYSEKEDRISIYKSYTNEALNKKFVVTEVIDQSPSNPADLKVSNPTLVRFQKNKIVEFITGKDNIISYFENL